jgi:hypothetical protein
LGRWYMPPKPMACNVPTIFSPCSPRARLNREAKAWYGSLLNAYTPAPGAASTFSSPGGGWGLARA